MGDVSSQEPGMGTKQQGSPAVSDLKTRDTNYWPLNTSQSFYFFLIYYYYHHYYYISNIGTHAHCKKNFLISAKAHLGSSYSPPQGLSA